MKDSTAQVFNCVFVCIVLSNVHKASCTISHASLEMNSLSHNFVSDLRVKKPEGFGNTS